MTDLLADLDDEQRVAAETLLGPVVILAGAGTGKTRALTHRIAHGVAMGVYDPSRVMALTFTTRAAGELRTRLRALGAGAVGARTFHATALAQLSHFWPQVVGGALPRILNSKGALLGQAAEALRLRVDTASLRDAAAEIEWRKVSRMSMAAYERAAASRSLPPGLPIPAMIELQQAYERIKDERRQIDFEDVLLATAGMLDSEPWVAEQVRAQYRFFVVDEYQDVSPLQQELLELWLGPRTDVCVVGDANQTIYSFTGATSDYLLGFASRYDDARVVRLERNYRSTPAILTVANRLMRGRPGALELVAASSLSPKSASGDGAPLADIGHRKKVGEEVGPPTAYDTDADEARGVAAAIAAEVASGIRADRIAVLYRVNAQAAALVTALADRGLSSRQTGSTKFFDLDIVKRVVLELGSVARSGPGPGTEPAPLFQSVSDILRANGWTQDPPEGANGGGQAVQERWEVLTALMELAEQAPAGTTLPQFVDELRARQAAQHEPAIAAVALSTLHGSKGLEWDSVHLIGLSEGLLPVSHAKGLAAIDEERRLLYVGITRARRTLRLSWSREGLRGQRREPSRFLAELRTGSPDAAATRAR